MTRTEFEAYIADYNSHDATRLARHFDPDVIFENFGGYHRGADVIAYMTSLHAVIDDVMDPQQILIDGDAIAMEAMFTLTALQDAPNLPIGPLAKGDSLAMRMFAFYRTQGARITHIKVSGWPPERNAPGLSYLTLSCRAETHMPLKPKTARPNTQRSPQPRRAKPR